MGGLDLRPILEKVLEVFKLVCGIWGSVKVLPSVMTGMVMFFGMLLLLAQSIQFLL